TTADEIKRARDYYVLADLEQCFSMLMLVWTRIAAAIVDELAIEDLDINVKLAEAHQSGYYEKPLKANIVSICE
ncbi:hypothetical protein NPIL_692401, partial [Nephila pilipes]